ncbi:hypothetical protein GCM10009836_49400 [Pseudonocardia ailaonensis]|uniref:Integral membrane protein n=1 Tax=Pseudonocardia ailaonensis TaxID=367279 RepID=A0ABN2NCM9_9PSEU
MTDLAVERWFLREGVPAIVRARHSAFGRMLPFTVLVLVYAPLFILLWAAFLPGVDDEDPPPEAAVASFVVSIAAIAVGVVAVLVFLRLRRTREVLRGTRAGLVGVGTALLLNFVAGLLAGGLGKALSDLGEAAVLLAVGLALALSGLGALLGWAVRRAVLRFGTMLSVATRAIPLLLLLVAFLFINAEAWQMSAELPRSRLWGVVGFLAVVTLVFFAVRLPKELARLEVPHSVDHVREACENTPLAARAGALEPGDLGPRHPLRRAERTNLVALLVVAQGLQILLLSVAVFAVFLFFGSIAIEPAVIEAWVGHPPTPGVLFGFPVGLPNELLQVSILIGALSGLYFAVYTITDADYRAEFLDGLLGEIQRILLARECYLHA